jgi:hypothetical protein
VTGNQEDKISTKPGGGAHRESESMDSLPERTGAADLGTGEVVAKVRPCLVERGESEVMSMDEFPVVAEVWVVGQMPSPTGRPVCEYPGVEG